MPTVEARFSIAHPRLTRFRKFGSNLSIAASPGTILADVGGTVPYFPTTAQAVEVLGGANDTLLGSGAQKIVIEGIDSNWKRVYEEIDMDGATPAAATNTYFRIDRAYVSQAGTNTDNNDAAITIRVGSGGTSFATIAAGLGQTLHTVYTTAANTWLYVDEVHFGVSSVKAVDLFWYQAQNANVATGGTHTKRIIQRYTGLTGQTTFKYENSIVFPPYTDVWVMGEATAGGGAASAELVGVVGY